MAPNGCDLNAAGVDKQDFVSLYYKLKGAMARDDRAAVASLVKYPLTIGRGRARRQIRNASGFVTNYDAIVNGCIKATVQRQKMGQLFCRDQGVMFGDGAVWVSNGPTDLQVIHAQPGRLHRTEVETVARSAHQRVSVHGETLAMVCTTSSSSQWS